MEKNDLFALLKIVKEYLFQIEILDENNIKEINGGEEQINEIFKNGTVINDQPIKKKLVVGMSNR